MKQILLRAIRLFLPLFVVLLASSCTNAQERSYEGTLPVQYYRNDANDVITLNIPKGHIDYVIHGGLPKQAIENDLYFVAEAGTLNPHNKTNGASFEYPKEQTQQIRFSIQSLYQVPPTERARTTQKVLMNRLEFLSRPCVRKKQATERFGLPCCYLTMRPTAKKSPAFMRWARQR